MEYQDIIDAASERVKDIASDIPTRPVEELMEYYFTTFVDKDGKILSIKIDECDYQLYFDIERQSDNTYALMGEVEIFINSTYIGMFDKNMNYIPPDEE